MNQSVIISIIVPCYNQAKYLDDCLESVINQKFQHWECIIVNDGSPDNINEIVPSWLSKDNRFKYVKKENGGLSSARNFGISISNGEFILPLDADDKIGKDYISKAIPLFRVNDRLKLVYCKAEKFGVETGIWDLPDYKFKDLLISNIIFCSGIYKKRDWIEVGGYDEQMVFGWEDWEFWISILKNGGLVHRINQVNFYYRVKPNSMIKQMDESKKKVLKNYIMKKHNKIYYEFQGNNLNKPFNYKYSGKRLNRSHKLLNVVKWSFFKKILNNLF